MHFGTNIGDGVQHFFVGLRLARTRLSTYQHDLRFVRNFNIGHNVHGEGINMWFVLLQLFFVEEDVLKVGRQHFFSIDLRNELKGIDDDKTVPNESVDLFRQKSFLELLQHLRSVNDVHVDEIPLDTVRTSAFLYLNSFGLERSSDVKHSINFGVGLVDGKGNFSFYGSFEVNISFFFIGLVDPALGPFLHPGNLKAVFITIHPCVHLYNSNFNNICLESHIINASYINELIDEMKHLSW